MQEHERTHRDETGDDEEAAICSNELLAAMRERIAKRKNAGKRSGGKEGAERDLENPS